MLTMPSRKTVIIYLFYVAVDGLSNYVASIGTQTLKQQLIFTRQTCQSSRFDLYIFTLSIYSAFGSRGQVVNDTSTIILKYMDRKFIQLLQLQHWNLPSKDIIARYINHNKTFFHLFFFILLSMFSFYLIF